MALRVGTTIGPYQVTALLGAGGMGEVYRARDTTLNRDVALKILPEAFAQDADRLARFRREAQVLASLNHPNIAQIYGLERLRPSRAEDGGVRGEGSASGSGGSPEPLRGAQSPSKSAGGGVPGAMKQGGAPRPVENDDTIALVMELVEGPTLADRLVQGALPVEEVLPIGRQIAEALEAAHEQGIIHRDLKPANVKVRDDGTVKVLDFGLAKALDPAGTTPNVSQSPTITTPAVTNAGTILGTAAYMSPEQAKGRPADRRSDVWAFGCVLYELLTGERAFPGEDVADTLANVLKAEPEWSALPPATPQSVRRLLQRSLQKDPRRRLPDIGVARLEIEDALATPLSGDGATVQTAVHEWPRWGSMMLALAVTAAIASAVGAGVAWTLKPIPSLAVSRSRFVPPEDHGLAASGRRAVAISPNGAQVAYTSANGLYLRPLADLNGRPLDGFEPAQVGFSDPVFSPDGLSIAFYQNGAIQRIPVSGGAPVVLCRVDSLRGLSWGDVGLIFAQPGRGVMRVAVTGGEPELLSAVAQGEEFNTPQLLPGGRALVFSIASGDGADRWNTAKIVAERLGFGDRKILVEGGSDPHYLPTGHLVYAVGGSLLAVAFDAERLEVTGPAVPVVQGLARGAPTIGAPAQFSASSTGSLIYIPGPSLSQGQGSLVLMDRDGDVQPLKLPLDVFVSPRVSPDGTQLAFGRDDGREATIWIYALSGASQPRRLTFGGNNRFPVWSADGQRVAFQSDRDGDRAIFWQRVDGTEPAERLTTPDAGTWHIPESWRRTGDRLTFSVARDAASSLWTLSVPDRRVAQFGDVQSSGPLNSAVSPDGRWVAYTLRSAGAANIYVEPFPPTGVKFQISRANGHHPVWLSGGRELSYRVGASDQVVVAFSATPSPEIGEPVSLPGQYAPTIFGGPGNYDVLPDGKRFVVVAPAGAGSGAPAQPEIHIVLNWFEELKRLVPRN